ncbi:MAG: helicase-exonuclease AddAB subunit AddA [Eubacteriales bacterium]|nr:helicase-exonuclease AddAB subunit AddA [Eubacteriales bacterium]
MNWTIEQKKIIENRGSCLLVSAAAGSGKTAVLVERIIRMITEGETPVSVDRLVIMTFTRAAAEEMRSRIAAALRARLSEDPDNAWLLLQKTMLPRARIMTIDSFCQNLIKQNYALLELDPLFRVPDEGELNLLMEDVLIDLLEARYEAGEENFLRFAECYGGARAEDRLKELILSLYRFIQANPWPLRFLEEQEQWLSAEMEGKLSELSWMRFLFEDIRERTAEYAEILRHAEELCGEPGGPLPYLPAVKELQEVCGRLSVMTDYGALYTYLSGLSFSRLGTVRGDKYDAELKEEAKTGIDSFRDYVKELRAGYAALPEDVLINSVKGSAPYIGVLLSLTREFTNRFSEKKREKNLVDFNDMEHLALSLLYTERDGEMVPSELADTLSEHFSEILIDEYQDSNEVQEALIRALSAERFGRPDVFMVGDIKQSIYRFRLAKPEIFMEKYDSYAPAADEGSDEGADEGKAHLKIELNRNFRSRREVLSSINDIFFRIMQRQVGGVAYTEDTALHPGAAFAQPEEEQDYRTELLLLNLLETEEADADAEKTELEGRMIADRILSMVRPQTGERPFLVSEKDGSFRRIRFSDIVILLRAPGSTAERLIDTLAEYGVPAYTENASGYFSAVEVETMLSYLSVIDNPHQDIPLAAVLRSACGGFSDAELARIRARFDETLFDGGSGREDKEEKEGDDESGRGEADGKKSGIQCADLYAALSHAAQSGDKKARAFLSSLSRYRELSGFLPVQRLLQLIYRESGYYDYVRAMPLGKQRRKNLDMLLTRAGSFAKTSYSGLFQFVRYIEKIKKYDTDYGEASVVSEQDDLVRVTSIHKSKGLEYPVVILAGADRQFNRQDAREPVMIDGALGIGSDYLDLETRVRYPGLKREVIRQKQLTDSCGEELRVLYVAMTRAREKLIVTAAVRDAEKKLEKNRYAESFLLPSGGLAKGTLLGAGSYLDMMLMGLPEHHPSLILRVISPAELSLRAAEAAAAEEQRYEALLSMDIREVPDAGFERQLSAQISASYAWEEETKLAPKKTVSEIKAGEALDHADYDDGAFSEGQYGKAAQTEEAFRAPGSGGAQRGTAFHRVFQLLNLTDGLSAEEELAAMTESGRLPEEEARLIDPEVLREFLKSPLAARMRDAKKRGRLYREQRFMIGLPACELSKESASKELQLLQGIMDAYFENEDGTLTLVDYKTDSFYQMTQEEAVKELLKRYSIQLSLYRKALCQLTEKEVKETLIYSTFLKREIAVPCILKDTRLSEDKA